MKNKRKILALLSEAYKAIDRLEITGTANCAHVFDAARHLASAFNMLQEEKEDTVKEESNEDFGESDETVS